MADVKFFEREAYNYEIVNQVKKTLDFFTMAGYDFTAHDITKAVRTMLGPKIKVDHKDVRDAVHVAMSGRPKYNKDINPQGAILYKSVNSNAVQVVTTQTIKTKNPSKVIVNTLQSTAPIITRPPKNSRKPDKRGTLTIPKAVLDNVSVIRTWAITSANGNTRTLSPIRGQSLPKSITKYTKNKSGNVRVTKNNLPLAPSGHYLVEFVPKTSDILIKGV